MPCPWDEYMRMGLNSFWLGEALGVLRSKVYVDGVDKLHSLYTVMILLFMSALITVSQVFGWPIHCWLPAEFEDKAGWREYVETYCFIHNTYFVPVQADLPSNLRVEVTYYQWVPLTLLIQALFFYLPGAIWQYSLSYYGVDLRLCKHKLISSKQVIPYYRRQELYSLASYLTQIMKDAKTCRPYFLTGCFLFCKLLYLLNLGIHLVFIYALLGKSGTEILWDFNVSFLFSTTTTASAVTNWRNTGLFPRVAFCDFSVAEYSQNSRHYTVQCSLAANIINEKIYAFLWFYFSFLVGTTLLNLAYWLYVTFIPVSQRSFLAKYTAKNKSEFTPFARDFDAYLLNEIGLDGLLVLRFIAHSSTDLITTDLILYCLRVLYATAECDATVVVLSIQSIVGAILQGLLVSLLITKILRPKTRQRHVIFSQNAVMCQENGDRTFQLRIGDIAKTHFVEAHVRMYCATRVETEEGDVIPIDMQDMNVGFDNGTDRILLMWPHTVKHIIDNKSPLHNVTKQSLAASENWEIIVVVEGIVEATGMTAQSRTSYLPKEVLWDRRFNVMAFENPETRRYQIHYSQFGETHSSVGDDGDEDGDAAVESGMRSNGHANGGGVSIPEGPPELSISQNTKSNQNKDDPGRRSSSLSLSSRYDMTNF